MRIVDKMWYWCIGLGIAKDKYSKYSFILVLPFILIEMEFID